MPRQHIAVLAMQPPYSCNTRANSRGRPHACLIGMEEADPVTERIIGCAIGVHKELGAGLLESAYETALCIELANTRIRFERQRVIPLVYKGAQVGEYRPDLIVEDQVVVEIKSVDRKSTRLN